MMLYVTPEELSAIGDEMLGVLWRYRDRIADRSKRPEGSRPIQVAVLAYPIEP